MKEIIASKPMKVSDLFYSIQGEGTHFGLAFVFVRFYRCNLHCDFCDEEQHKIIRFELTVQELFDKIHKFGCKRVILTGGEPTMEDRNPLIEKLQENGYFVAIETNGYKPENVSKADWITYSPKEWMKINFDFGNELKLVTNLKTPLSTLFAIADRAKVPIFLQPEYEEENQGLENVKFCRDLILKNPERFRLSLQTQKLIHIP